MVSNDEIIKKLKDQRDGKNLKGYLVCDTCHGSYELQPGEKPEDFSNECECGGNLTYSKSISHPSMDEDTQLIKIIKKGTLFFVVILGLLLFFTIFIYPYVYMEEMAIQTHNPSQKDVKSYNDQLAALKTNYTSLQNQYNDIEKNVDSSNRQSVKSIFKEGKTQLSTANSSISEVNTALSSNPPAVDVQSKISVAQSQLTIAQRLLDEINRLLTNNS